MGKQTGRIGGVVCKVEQLIRKRFAEIRSKCNATYRMGDVFGR